MTSGRENSREGDMSHSFDLALPETTISRLRDLAAHSYAAGASKSDDLTEFVTKILTNYVQEYNPKPGVIVSDLRGDDHPVVRALNAILVTAIDRYEGRLVLPRESGFDGGELINSLPVSLDWLFIKRLQVMMTPMRGVLNLTMYDKNYVAEVEFIDATDKECKVVMDLQEVD